MCTRSEYENKNKYTLTHLDRPDLSQGQTLAQALRMWRNSCPLSRTNSMTGGATLRQRYPQYLLRHSIRLPTFGC